MKTVRDACTPAKNALEFSMTEQIEDLKSATGDLALGNEFFKKNHITAGQRQLLEMGLKRLDGRDTQALFELTQAMGGGKTHSMIAFGLLARHSKLREEVIPDVAERISFTAAKVVAYSGRSTPEHFIWGEVAEQLGQGRKFEKFWQNGPKAPDEPAWLDLLGDDPTLILLDELPPYLENAATISVGGGTLAQATVYALSSLFSAALKKKNVCIVLANLSGSYQNAATSLHSVLKNLEGEARRQAKLITPVELGGDEIYQILKKRLFTKLPAPRDIDAVADGYAKAIGEAEKSRTIAKSTEQIAHEIRQSYPFHPAIKDIIALFRNNESYRQTRGLMKFVAGMIRSIWNRQDNDVYLVGLQYLNLNDPEVREEIKSISDLSNAIAHDIAAGGQAVAEVIDGEKNSDAGSQVAALILTSSLASGIDAVKGLNRQRLLEFLVAPGREALEFSEAFDTLKAEAWYLHKDQSEAYFFANNENLTKRLSVEAERAPSPKIDKLLRERLESIFEPKRKAAYQELYALPKIDEVSLKGERVLLILSPDSTNPPQEAKNFYASVTEKNNVCILTGDTSNIANLEEKTRMIWAIAKVQNELPESDPKQAELAEKMEAAEQEFNSTVTSIFNRIWYPLKDGLTPAKLSMTFEGNEFDGEEQIEKTLAQVGVSKLELDIERDPTPLFVRAEDQLWPEKQKRVPWRDIKTRSLVNPRWKWLPKDGLELLRKLAQQRDRWRYTEDGYIEKGPFEQPKTDVVITQTNRDDTTGEATLEIVARDAGKNAVVYWDTKPSVSARSNKLSDKNHKTNAVRLWFVAVDPKGEHETGPAKTWSNSLTLRHDVKGAGDKRTVKLEVVPAGAIKYTLNGANPAEGTEYTTPIEVGTGETTVYCYAEADGVTTKRNFTILKAGSDTFKPDPTRPAKLNRRMDATSTAEAFKLIATARTTRVTFTNIVLNVGQGDKNVSARFGSGTAITGEVLEEVIKVLRTALANEEADTRLTAHTLNFSSGHDLSSFAQEYGFEPSAAEVEQ